MTKAKRSNGEPVDLSGWCLPAVENFAQSIQGELVKGIQEALECAAEHGVDAYFTIGCPPIGRGPIDPMDITLGLPLGLEDNNIEFRVSLRVMVEEAIARSYDMRNDKEASDYLKKMAAVSDGLKEMAALLDRDIAKFQKAKG